MPVSTPPPLVLVADSPRELLTAGLSALLSPLAHRTDVDPTTIVAVPVRGQGSDLAALFLDLIADLAAQRDEFGAGLDQIAIDGVLRTETGGYTAWGYLTGQASGGPGAIQQVSALSITGETPLMLTMTVAVDRIE